MSTTNMGGETVYTKTLGIKFADGSMLTTATFPQRSSVQSFTGLTSTTYPTALATFVAPVAGIYQVSSAIWATALNSGAGW